MLIKLGKVIVLSISLLILSTCWEQPRKVLRSLTQDGIWLTWWSHPLPQHCFYRWGRPLPATPWPLPELFIQLLKIPLKHCSYSVTCFSHKVVKEHYHIAAQIHQWNMVKQNSHGYKHGIWFSHGYLYLMPQPGMPQTNGLSWRCTAFTCWRRFDFWGYKFKWKIDVIKSLRKWSHKQNYCSYGWKCVEKTLEVASDSLWGTSWFMCPEVPLDVLPQLLGATCLTDNMLVAGLEMSLEALFISEMFKTSWFGTDCLEVQFNCNG